jgi:hypothetical protein
MVSVPKCRVYGHPSTRPVAFIRGYLPDTSSIHVKFGEDFVILWGKSNDIFVSGFGEERARERELAEDIVTGITDNIGKSFPECIGDPNYGASPTQLAMESETKRVIHGLAPCGGTPDSQAENETNRMEKQLRKAILDVSDRREVNKWDNIIFLRITGCNHFCSICGFGCNSIGPRSVSES